MGYDVYMRWKGQTEDERQAQYTGFSIVHGHVGYLREAYHGNPYATKVLVPEAYRDDAPSDGAVIPARLLRERLPATLDACATRHRTIYHDDEEEITRYQQSYVDFVALAEQKEAELGEPVRIVVS